MKIHHLFKNLVTLLIGITFSTLALGATVALSNQPLNKLTTGDVKPNVLFVLDDSGSMTWTYLPDKADNFRGKYGYLSSQCNGVAYNPNTTYDPPITTTSTAATPQRMADASFTAARDNGYDSSSTAHDLNSQFIANRFVPEGANTDYRGFGSYTLTNASIGPFGAVYYQYTGTVSDRDFINQGSTFYTECITQMSNTFSAGTSTTAPTTTVGTSGLGVNAPFTRVRLASTETTTITVSGIGANSGGNGTISSITVHGVELMSGASTGASGITSTQMAANIAAKITLNGFSATASGSVITITGPTSAAGFTPVIGPIFNGGTLAFTTDVFPYTTPAKLTNFANWYSFYRTRMLSMKTAAGDAFSSLDNSYRLGFMKINDSKPQVNIDIYSGTQRSNWYTALYGVSYSTGGTPLRISLSTAGRYYAKKLGGTVPDPVQYACQQNFTLLSTDGYWNDSTGGVMLDGSTLVGNQDGSTTDSSGNVVFVDRPMFDGSAGLTKTYSRSSYSISTSGCTGGKKKLVTQVQQGTCQAADITGSSCTPSSWTNNGSPTASGCSSTVTLPTPNPSNSSQTSSVDNAGGASDTLADAAMYYYQTDLRDATLSNCTGATRPDGTTGDVCYNGDSTGAGGVPKTTRDSNSKQHMTTFTLGLGANGVMDFIPNYESAPGDFASVRDGVTANGTTICSWQTGGTCNWPVPNANDPTAIDDMWHAAVNGHGTYYSASNPDDVSTGIRSALGGISQRRGSAAAASSSSLSPVAGNNSEFIATFTNKIWTGNLESRTINTITGAASLTATWCAESINRTDTCSTPLVAQNLGNSTIYNCETAVTAGCTSNGGVVGFSGNQTSGQQYCKTQVSNDCTGTFTTARANPSITSPIVLDNSDARTIKTAKLVSGKNVLTDFDAAFATANSSYFDSTKLSGLSQWSSLGSTAQGTGPSQRATAVAQILGYLRGQYGYDTDDNNVVYTAGLITTDNRLFRKRETVLGDILESNPTFNGMSLAKYGYPGYDAFKTAQNSNSAVTDGSVYVGANDGMLHSIDAITGHEQWAYIPSMVVPNMWKLADLNYSSDDQHRNYVNGSPAIADVCVSSCTDTNNAVWKTILVGGLNGGGRGYYALDITNPATPILLWEFTTSSGIGAITDNDLGYSFAKPNIVRKQDGSWVVLVSSGYNNVSPGDGVGYLYELDAKDGTILRKISTGLGSTSTPSGLGKIATWNNASPGNEAGYVYGGDLFGNVWKFNINDNITTASIGHGSVTKFATLFSNSSGTQPQPITTTPNLGLVGTNRVIYIATGKFLEANDSPDGTSAFPTYTQSVYAIKDDPSITATFVNPRNTLVNQTISNVGTTTTRTVASPQVVNFASDRGWYADLPETAERVNEDTILTQGVLYVPSLVPAASACEPGGHGWFNYFNYATGGPVQGLVSERTQYPIVGLNAYYVNGGETIVHVTLSDGGGGEMGPPVTGTAGKFVGKRTLWRELTQ
jgi:type IV pilus assembly protein PilY1